MISIVQILTTAVREKASDIHITSGNPPCLRVDGKICTLNVAPLSHQESKNICYSVLTSDQKATFEKKKDLDFSFSVDKLGRFRAHLFYNKNKVCGSFRHIQSDIPQINELGLPRVLYEILRKPYGLVLVTGPTGSGKTTTLASMINEINKTQYHHIITIEDPIEYIFSPQKSIITQREVGNDVVDFHESLRALLRMDPDVVLVGELRDKETIKAALQVAETGHLVFGTLHANTTYTAVDRLTGVFSGDERGLIQTQLSTVLQGIISQRLLPLKNNKGRVPALEILLFNPAVRNMIKEGKLNQIYSVIQTSTGQGMQTMNQALQKLVTAGFVNDETAYAMSPNTSELSHLLQGRKHQRRGA